MQRPLPPQHPSGRLAGRLVALAIVLASASRAGATCNATACDAAGIVANAACCTAASCTIDGTLTVSGSPCTFDFGARNLTVSGKIVAQGDDVMLKAKSLKLTGFIDVRGPAGPGGSVTIVTTGLTGLAYSQQSGTSAVVDASSPVSKGGTITIKADGPVAFSTGTVNASGGPGMPGGVIDVSTTAGDISVQTMLSANQFAEPAAGQRGGEITFTGSGNLMVGGSGRVIADMGSVSVNVAGTASFADGSVVQSNVGGDITMVAGTLTGNGEFRSVDDFGSVDLTAHAGPMTLSRLSQGITVGPSGSVSLTTDLSGAPGLLTMDSPILASGASVDIEAGGALTVSKKIQTTGILDSGAGEVNLSAVGNTDISKAIVTSDVYSVEDITVDVDGDLVIEGTLEAKGGLDADGGVITATATGAIAVQGDITVNVSGADSSSAGSIDIEAGKDLTIANTVELLGAGSPIGAGGNVTLLAGVDEFGLSRVPGNVTLAGDIIANGHALAGGNVVTIDGCAVSIPAGAIIDITGDPASASFVTARTALSIAGQMKASGANVLTYATSVTPMLTGAVFVPARTPGTCAGAVQNGNCVLPVCTDEGVPAGCLDACPNCGDGNVQFPETCETGGGGTFCNGGDFCDARCRVRHCTDANPCTDNACDPLAGCTIALKPNGFACNDNTICDGTEMCENGACVTTPGSAPPPGCSDNNPCTDDFCDSVSGCMHTPVTDHSIVVGCSDGNPCTGVEECIGGACQPGTLVTCPPGQVCNPADGTCQAGACTTPAQCNDGNPCTQDVCSGGVCSNPIVTNGTSCDDGDLCNGLRSCQNGICQPPTPPVVCEDNNPCTTDTCNTATGTCTFQPPPGEAADCNDNNACTVDACVNHACTHTTISCVDNNVCTNDTCNNGVCQHVVDPTCCSTVAECTDDADPCTDKACIANRCMQIASPNCCNADPDCVDIDRNPCTDNGPCNLATHRCGGPTPLTGPACGTVCNPATCQGGTCMPDTPKDCNDNNPCTSDICTGDQGCTHAPIDGCCFSTAQCMDNNVCTTDACDLDRNGCNHVVPDPTCTPCVGGDPFECGPRCQNACVGGRCQEVTADCNDNNPCTTDTCDATTGCTHTNKSGGGVTGCDDGQACNGVEQCVNGACQHQPVPDCDDDDLCTDDSCADATGCVHGDKTSFDGITCRLADMRARITAGAAGSNARMLAQLGKKVDKLAAKVGTAGTAGTKCGKAKRLLAGVAKTLRGLQRTVNRAAGRKLDPSLATMLAERAGEAASHCDDVRSGLGC